MSTRNEGRRVEFDRSHAVGKKAVITARRLLLLSYRHNISFGGVLKVNGRGRGSEDSYCASVVTIADETKRSTVAFVVVRGGVVLVVEATAGVRLVVVLLIVVLLVVEVMMENSKRIES